MQLLRILAALVLLAQGLVVPLSEPVLLVLCIENAHLLNLEILIVLPVDISHATIFIALDRRINGARGVKDAVKLGPFFALLDVDLETMVRFLLELGQDFLLTHLFEPFNHGFALIRVQDFLEGV